MHPLVLLAKKAVENYIKEGKVIEVPRDFPKEFLEKRAGTFVTIKKNDQLRGQLKSKTFGSLRGCIGTYLPTRENIAKEIIYNAIAAATEDYRFGPIEERELSSLSYTVYILSEPELVKDISELDPKKFGIIVKTAPITSPKASNEVVDSPFLTKTGLLLPDLDGIDTKEEQISIACQKGDIDPLKDKVLIYKFETEKYQ